MARRKKGNPVHGWINLNKPVGITSSKAVAIVKRAFNAQKAGHAGTLDPLADGILPLALGEATKTVPYIQDSLKGYEFTIIWGEQRTTDDAEGDVVQASDARPTREQLEALLPQYTGHIRQIPPIYSAIKIDGQRAYDLARYGDNPELIEMPEREVYVETLELLSFDEEKATLFCHCGKGTYIRSIARDLALACGCYGYVGRLHRRNVSYFSTSDAISLDFFEENNDIASLEAVLLPVSSVLDDIPALPVTEDEAALLRNGQFLQLFKKHDVNRLIDAGLAPDAETTYIALAIAPCGTEVGLISIQATNIKPERIFNL